MNKTTHGYEVNGNFAGTLFLDVRGLAIVPKCFLGTAAAALQSRALLYRGKRLSLASTSAGSSRSCRITVHE